MSHTHDYCPTCNETVIVSLPERKKTNLVRYNQKEEIREEPRVEFSLAGSAVRSNGLESGSVESLQSSESSNAALAGEMEQGLRNENNICSSSSSKVVLKGRRARPLKTGLPKFTDVKETPDLSLGLGAVSVPHTSVKPSISWKPRSSKPPPAPRERSKETVDVDIDLRIGTGGSPVDIIKRISSVHERPGTRTTVRRVRRPSRDNTRSRSPSVGADIQPDLVAVSGTRIS